MKRPDLSPRRRSSHPPTKNQSGACPAKQIKKDEPFDPEELARRLEQMRLQTKSAKANRLKRSSLCIGNLGEPSVPIDSFIPPVPEVPDQERPEPLEITRNSVDRRRIENLNGPKNLASSDPIRPQTAVASSQKFKPNSSISAFLATTSPRSQHVQPHSMVYEMLHNELQHPNPYHPGLEPAENGDVAIEDIDEVEDAVEEPYARPALGPQDRPDWTQRSQCGDQIENKHMLSRSKSRRKVVDEREEVDACQNRAQPHSAHEILSRSHHSVRIPPGSTRPDLKTKPRAFSQNDMLSKPPKETNEERRVSHGEPLPARSKKKSSRWPDVMATRQDGVTAAERHRDWLEQLREQERAEAAAREREQKEQEILDARKKAKRKASFRWTLLDKMKIVRIESG